MLDPFITKLQCGWTIKQEEAAEHKRNKRSLDCLLKDEGFKKGHYAYYKENRNENTGHEPNKNSLWISERDNQLAVSIDTSTNAGGETLKVYVRGLFIGTYNSKGEFVGHGLEKKSPNRKKVLIRKLAVYRENLGFDSV